MTRASKLAWCIIGGATVGWVVTGALVPDAAWGTVLRHAFEGAVVGGLCDAYAIWKVYRKIEENFVQVTDEVSVAVIDDMVQPESVVTELTQRLHEPRFARDLMDRVEALAPDEQSIRTFIQDVWQESLRGWLVEWLVAADPREALEGGERNALVAAVVTDDEIRGVVHRCLRQAVDHPGRSAAMYQAIREQYGDRTVFEIPPVPIVKPRPTPVSLESVLRHTLDEAGLRAGLLKLVDALAEPPGERGPVPDQLRDYALAYVTAWTEMSIEERTQAAEQLVDRVAPSVLDSAAQTLWEHRVALQQVVQQDLPLNAIPLVDYVSDEVSELVRDQLSDLDERSQELLQGRLAAMGPRRFRMMLESRTRGELDWIQVNGSLLGFVLGGIVGSLDYLWMH